MNLNLKIREPIGAGLPAAACRPPELAQRHPHTVPGLGEQRCKDEESVINVCGVWSKVRQQRGDRLKPSAESEAFSGAAVSGVCGWNFIFCATRKIR